MNHQMAEWRKGTLFSLILMLLVLCCGVPAAQAATVYTNLPDFQDSFPADAALEDKLAILRAAFPEGYYWNYHTQSELESHQQKKVTVNNITSYISTRACVGTASKSDHDYVTSNRALCQSNDYNTSRRTRFRDARTSACMCAMRTRALPGNTRRRTA